MSSSGLYVSEGGAILGCLMSPTYKKQVMPKLAWVFA